MKNFTIQLVLYTIIIVAVTSCVPSRLLEESKEREKKCSEELSSVKKELRETSESNKELKNDQERLQKQVKQLEQDTASQGKYMSKLTKNYDKLNDTYNLLLEKNKELEMMNKNENKRLAGDLQQTQEQLQKKEDMLRKLSADLDKREESLKELETSLKETNEKLSQREIKVKELQNILNAKDSTVNALRSKVNEALLGFVNNGLTVENKNGKVYVSMEESLLFNTGSTNVDAKGVDALKKLAKVLEQNTDINVLIEGHTDDVPFNSAGGHIKDNWELSVLRATSILKILLANGKIDPVRLEAAGRGEFMPLDPGKNAEARRRNRRTEIILTPKLNELFKILETN